MTKDVMQEIKEALENRPAWTNAEAATRFGVLLQMALDEIERRREQLPEEMEDCTIRFLRCVHGHGWLTATNWVQHLCPTCQINELKARVEQ